jgi:hypothetical protein
MNYAHVILSNSLSTYLRRRNDGVNADVSFIVIDGTTHSDNHRGTFVIRNKVRNLSVS